MGRKYVYIYIYPAHAKVYPKSTLTVSFITMINDCEKVVNSNIKSKCFLMSSNMFEVLGAWNGLNKFNMVNQLNVNNKMHKEKNPIFTIVAQSEHTSCCFHFFLFL